MASHRRFEKNDEYGHAAATIGVDGSVVESRWEMPDGTRPLQRQKHADERRARIDALNRMQLLLRDGFRGVPYEGAPPYRVAEEPAFAWDLERIAKSYGNSVVGGDEVVGLAGAWPRCATCELPLAHLATIESTVETLSLKSAGVAMFLCTSRDSKKAGCQSRAPRSGANAAVLLVRGHAAKKMPKVPPRSVKILPRAGLTTRGKYADAALLDSNGTVDPAFYRSGVSKLRGHGDHLALGIDTTHNDYRCRACGSQLEYRAQLGSSVLKEAPFAEDGLAFLFICPKQCEAVMAWSDGSAAAGKTTVAQVSAMKKPAAKKPALNKPAKKPAKAKPRAR